MCWTKHDKNKKYCVKYHHSKWIICPWNETRWITFLFACLFSVSFVHVKFHPNLLNSKGGDVLTGYAQTESVGPIHNVCTGIPPNIVCSGIKNLIKNVDQISLFCNVDIYLSLYNTIISEFLFLIYLHLSIWPVKFHVHISFNRSG